MPVPSLRVGGGAERAKDALGVLISKVLDDDRAQPVRHGLGRDPYAERDTSTVELGAALLRRFWSTRES